MAQDDKRPVPLEHVSVLSAVSGGSYAAAGLYSHVCYSHYHEASYEGTEAQDRYFDRGGTKIGEHFAGSVKKFESPHNKKFPALSEAARKALPFKISRSDTGNPNYLVGTNLVRLVSILVFSWIVSVLCAISLSVIVADIFIGFGCASYISHNVPVIAVCERSDVSAAVQLGVDHLST